MRLVPRTTVLSMAVYGASGVAFVGANLLLARMLSTEQYALLTLLVALVTLGYHLAPVGLDALILRGRVAVDTRLLARAAALATAVGAATSAAAFVAYGLPAAAAAVLLGATAAGGLMLVASARFQSEQRFKLALALQLAPNLVLLLGALLTIVSGATTAGPAVAVLALGLGAAAVVGWALLLGERRSSRGAPAAIPWRETFVLAGVSAAGMLFIQLERLVIPHVLTVHDLALFGVLGAVAGSVFRVLQMGVGFGLLPRLRAAASVPARRRLLARELRFAVVIAAAGAAAVLVLVPLVERWFLAGKYHLPMALLVAALFSGVAKIAHAFARVTATALATSRELALINGAGWLSVALAVGASIAAAPWGLAGVVYAVGLGWLTWAAAAFALVMHHLRLPAGVPAAT